VSLVKDFIEAIFDPTSVNIQVDNICGGSFVSEEDAIIGMDVKFGSSRARSSRSN
jgi:hypothetical protein